MTLNKETSISIGLVIVIIGALFGAAAYINNNIEKVSGNLVQVIGELKSVESQVAQMKSDQYTVSQAAEQALRTAIENPGMRVPDPRNPGSIITVRNSGHL